MKLGIITVLYASDKVIDDFIKCLNRQTFRDFEVLFVENDVEKKYCEEVINRTAQFPYRFTRNEKNEGVARGNNQGIDYFLGIGNCHYLLFLNNDIEFNDTFLEDQMALVEAKTLDALAPKMYYYKPEGKIWYAGGCLSYWKGGPRHYGHNKPDRLIHEQLYRIDYAPTCSLMIKKDIIERTGIRMWEQLFVYYDDYVFCYELRQHQVKLWYTPAISLLHKVSSSTESDSTFSRYYMSRNWAYLVRKHKNLIGMILLPLRYLYNAITGRDVENRGYRDSFRMP